MHLAVAADNVLEQAALAAGVVPLPLVAGFWGMGLSRCVIAGTRLGVFEALEPGSRSAAEVAAATGCDPTGMETLLNALNGFGYVSRGGGSYRNTRLTRRWLLKKSRFAMTDAVLFFADLWDQMSNLEEAVLTGKPRRFHDAGMPDEFWGRYMRGLATFARVAGREVVRRTRLPDPPARLLDAGGGHGLYSAAFCRKYPGLRAEVLDLPGACSHGRAIVAEAGLSDRVVHREGDLRTDAWGQGYDLILLFNVLHNATRAESAAMLNRAHEALAPGGTLAILDSEHREFGGNLSTTAGFNELFFFLLNGTRAYPEATLREWLTAAGFGSLKTERMMMAPAVLLTGTKAAAAR